MQLTLQVRNSDLAGALRGYIDRRLRFALSRFGDHVGRVVVKISGLNGSRGGTRKGCHIAVDMKPVGRVVAHETDLDLYVAIDRATGRIGRLFSQRLQRSAESSFVRQTVRAA